MKILILHKDKLDDETIKELEKAGMQFDTSVTPIEGDHIINR